LSPKDIESLKQEYEQMTARLNELNRTISARQNELIEVQFKLSQAMNQYIQLQETRDKLQQEIVHLRLLRQSLVKEESETFSSSDFPKKEPSDSNLIKETAEDVTELQLSSATSLPFALSPRTVSTHRRRRLIQRRFSTTNSCTTLSSQDSKTSISKSDERTDNDEMPMPIRSRSRSSISDQSSPSFPPPATFDSCLSSPETPRSHSLNSNTNKNNNDNNKSSVQQIISKLNSATMADEFIPMPIPQRKTSSPLLQRHHSVILSPPSSKK
jgi:myosin heavy subunit